MSVLGYFTRQAPAVETRWERERREHLLRESGRWGREWVGGIRRPDALEVHVRAADYDPVLQAHCRVGLE